MKKIKRAIISLSNKENLLSILKTLSKYKIEIISSGGTYKEIKKLKYKCTEISNYTSGKLSGFVYGPDDGTGVAKGFGFNN